MKKNITYNKIKNRLILLILIFCSILFIHTTYLDLHKKYILRKEGMTVKGKIAYTTTEEKVRVTICYYFYCFKIDGKEYFVKSRQHFSKENDSIDIVFLPNNPNYNAVKKWVDQSWIVPPYWP